MEPAEPNADPPSDADPPTGELVTGEPVTADLAEPGARRRRGLVATIAAALVVLAVLVAALAGGTRVTEAAVVDTGSPITPLGVGELPTTTSTAPPESTSTTAPPETTVPPSTGSTVPGRVYVRPPRPKVDFKQTVHQAAYPKANGTIWLTGGPGSTAGTISFPNPRQVGDNPNALVPLVFLVKRDMGDWLEVYVPARPNGSTAWIQKKDVTIVTHKFRIEVYLQEFTLRAYDGDKLLMDTTIGVAKASTPTPIGIFYTTELVRPSNPGGPYGPYAYGLSGFSDVLLSFGGGPGQLGIHGTNQPWALGTEVSSGCIRLANADITTLAGMVPIGTPVIINDRF